MQKYLPRFPEKYWVPAVLFVIGLMVIGVRNPDPFLNPILYTEDGAWLGLAFSKGWLYTFFNARSDYLVWGNLFLLWGAETCSNLICGNALVCLPQSIGLLSLAFFSGIATFAFFATRDAASVAVRLLLFALLLLLPLGDSSNEILGRLSNIGYMFVLLALLLISYREMQVSASSRYIADAVLILAAATNPVVILLIVMYLVWRFYRAGVREWRRDLVLLLGVGLVGMLVAYKMFTQQHSVITGVLHPENLVEVGIARAILYPLVFPYYTALTNSSTVTLFLLWVAFVMLAVLRSHGRAKVFMAYSAVALITFWASTLVMRPSLTQLLSGYDHTFPDRYFMGLNAIVLVITLVGASSLLKDSKRIFRIGSVLLLTILVALYSKNLPWIFETNKPRMVLMTGTSFPAQLCQCGKNLNAAEDLMVSCPIYFSGWSIMVPSQELLATTVKLGCYELKPLK